MRPLLLQCKFFLVAFLNASYNIIPNPIRKYYLRMYGIKIGSGSCIHRSCRFFHVGKLQIGRNSVVNFGCYLDNRRGIIIGNNVGLAHNVKVYTLGHNIDSPEFETKGAPVKIEDGVFIFANAMIMPGVTLHKNSVVLPGSVVTKDVEEKAVVGGNPIKVVRHREEITPPYHILTSSPYRGKTSSVSILFLLKTFDVGGVEIVTAILANKFVREGHRISIFAFSDAEHSIVERFNKEVRTYTLRKLEYNDENVYAMRAVMLEDKVNVVINQWGLPFVPIQVARKAAEGLNIKFISVYHNTPDMNGRLQGVDMQIASCHSSAKRAILRMKRWLYGRITAMGMRYNYKYSDRYMVLSPSFIEKFKAFTGIKNPTKLLVQTNPVTIDTMGYTYDKAQKQNEILFVGRLENVQKKVSRIVDVWKELEPTNADWRMTIVGDGEERDSMEEQCRQLNLKNIHFEGFQNPAKYYERASILILTSDFEGFPLVLAECMSFGVVPVVYGSYSAVYDIIEDGKNGIVVQPEEGGFDAHSFATALQRVMGDDKHRNEMAEQAIITSNRDYSIDTIYKQWMEVIT